MNWGKPLMAVWTGCMSEGGGLPERKRRLPRAARKQLRERKAQIELDRRIREMEQEAGVGQ